MQATIRRGTAGDATALVGLRLRELTEFGDPSTADPAGFAAVFTAWLSANLATHLPFLAEVDGEVVGMAWLMVAERVPSPERRFRRHGDVQSVYVLPEQRARGIGAALLAALLVAAGELQLEHVTVHSSSRAVPLYQRAGFQQHRSWLRWAPG